MPNMTLSFPPETKKLMENHPHVRWSNVVRTIIEQRLKDFEEAERIANKSRLTQKDVDDLTEKVNQGMRKHAEAMLHERHSRR